MLRKLFEGAAANFPIAFASIWASIILAWLLFGPSLTARWIEATAMWLAGVNP